MSAKRTRHVSPAGPQQLGGGGCFDLLLRPTEIEFNKSGENVVGIERMWPAVSGVNGSVDLLMRLRQPRRRLVVEARVDFRAWRSGGLKSSGTSGT
jgi:hypothetical protein